MELGTYLTSFLRIYINTNLELDSMRKDNLTDYEKRVFVHEYTHFLQNIGGTFGHLHAWHTYDRLRQYIADLHAQGVKEIAIPLTGAVADEQERLLRMRKRMQGSYKVRDGMDDGSTKITNIRLKKDEDMEIQFPGSALVHHLVLELKDGEGEAMEYIFGEAVVSEAMALLMESKYFETDPATNFPYHACRLLAVHLETNLMDSDEILFALCDVALMASYPGMMFYRILLDMHQKEFKPQSGEEVINYGIKFMEEAGWDVYGDFEKSMNGACHVIKTLFQHPIFTDTVEWICYLFRLGFQCRVETPYFMIQLFREPTAFEGFWNNVMAQWGNPELHNNTPKRAFAAPLALKNKETTIEPIMLLALKEVQETLLNGKTHCDLHQFCRHNTNGLIVDERCNEAPWLRSSDEPTCAYGALWAALGLRGKKVVLPT